MLSKEEQELAARNEYNFDHPDAFDFELLVTVLRKLKKGKSIKVPVYDFTTHARRKEWVSVCDNTFVVNMTTCLFSSDAVVFRVSFLEQSAGETLAQDTSWRQGSTLTF